MRFGEQESVPDFGGIENHGEGVSGSTNSCGVPGGFGNFSVSREEIRVRGDLAAAYGPIAEVLGAISGAGFKKIGLETEVRAAEPQN